MSSSSEQTPFSQGLAQLGSAYGTSSHATFKIPPDAKSEVLVDYEPLKFSSLRVCCISKGTILTDGILFTEQILITLIFIFFALPEYFNIKNRERGVVRTPDVNKVAHEHLMEKEERMRSFAMIMTGLAAFLLSFYTSIVVARWWTMRTGGVGAIKAATVDLELLLYQNVTKETDVLSAVQRYGRTSLMLIFLWRRRLVNPTDDAEKLRGVLQKELMNYSLLTEHEIEQLLKWKHCLHETIWAWQAGIVSMLYKEGKIKSDQLYACLLQKCLDGRAAVQLVHTHLAVRVPMQYVHLLGLLVKMHNFVVAVIMGLLFGEALHRGELIICAQLFGRTLILPFLFNAILLINAELSDPFDGSPTDFPGLIYQGALEKDCVGMVDATQNMPGWLHERYSSGLP